MIGSAVIHVLGGGVKTGGRLAGKLGGPSRGGAERRFTGVLAGITVVSASGAATVAGSDPLCAGVGAASVAGRVVPASALGVEASAASLGCKAGAGCAGSGAGAVVTTAGGGGVGGIVTDARAGP